jgi:pre-rRNA-processing protein IPI1
VQLLDVLLQVVPECVVLRGPSDHGDRVLQGYLGLLNISGRHTDDQGVPLVSKRPTVLLSIPYDDAAPPSGVVLSAASQLLVLNSLNTFLELSTSIAKAAQPEGDQEEPWFLATSFATEMAYQNFIRKIQPWRCSQRMDRPPFLSWLDRNHAPISSPFFSLIERTRPWSAFDIGGAEELFCSLDDMHTLDDCPEWVTSLARSLQPTLISTFLDNVPATLGPSSSSSKALIIETKLVHVIGRLARALYSPILRQPNLVGKKLCESADILIHVAF